MKFVVNQTTLSKALSLVSKGAGISSTLPVLNSVKLSTVGGDIELQTTDLNIAIKHIIRGSIQEEGSILVSLRVLLSIIKTLPDAPITFETTDGGINLSCSDSVFFILTLSVDEFPSFPEYEVQSSVQLSTQLLNKMVERVYKVTSHDVARPILSGILFTADNNTLRLVAVDSHRLSICDTNTETSSLHSEFSIVVPGKAFHDALSLSEKNENITLAASENHIIFTFPHTTFVSRKIEGTFPNYKQLLPQSSKTSVSLPLEALSEALRRVSSIVSQNPSVQFTLNVEEKRLVLTTINKEAGKAKEILSISGEGESMTFALNNRYVQEGINPLLNDDQTNITLELQDSTQPAIFKSFGKINYLYLLMPIRM